MRDMLMVQVLAECEWMQMVQVVDAVEAAGCDGEWMRNARDGADAKTATLLFSFALFAFLFVRFCLAAQVASSFVFSPAQLLFLCYFLPGLTLISVCVRGLWLKRDEEERRAEDTTSGGWRDRREEEERRAEERGGRGRKRADEDIEERGGRGRRDRNRWGRERRKR
jgi:hypothetical protein